MKGEEKLATRHKRKLRMEEQAQARIKMFWRESLRVR